MAWNRFRHRVVPHQPEDDPDEGRVDGEEAQKYEQSALAERFGVTGKKCLEPLRPESGDPHRLAADRHPADRQHQAERGDE